MYEIRKHLVAVYTISFCNYHVAFSFCVLLLSRLRYFRFKLLTNRSRSDLTFELGARVCVGEYKLAAVTRKTPQKSSH